MIVKCKSCGSNLRYDIAKKSMACTRCDSTYNAEDLDKDESRFFDVTEYRCADCGAKLITNEDTEATAFCSYCGSTSILTDRLEKLKKPDAIIPFRITKEECKRRYLQHAKSVLFAPSWLKKEESIDSFRAIYMPYWRYKIYVHNAKARKALVTTYREGDYIITRTHNWSGKLSAQFEGPAHDASNAFADDISEAIGFTDEQQDEVPFHPAYMSGFYADEADVDPKEFKEGLKTVIPRTIEARLSLVSRLQTDLKDKRLVYYPVWFMCQRNGKEMTYAAVNGVNGKVVADYPIATRKFLALAAILTVLAFLFLSMAIVLRPEPAFWMSALIFGAGMFLMLREKKKWVQALQEKNVKVPRLLEGKLLPVMDILAAIVAVVFAFSRDNVTIYAGTLILAVVFILNIITVFSVHQIIARRRPPQFNRKGADDRA